MIIVGAILSSSAVGHQNSNPPKWGFQKFFGTYDRAALQRGFQVYKEVCSTCHSLKRIRFRELSALGFSKAEIKALAATYSIKTLGDKGEETERKGESGDAIPEPYANDFAARAANNDALPPDQSLIIKARHDGADYVYKLLTSYGQIPPKGIVVEEGQYYNPIISGGQISMASPLMDGLITYSDGTKATTHQMARDVVEFLAWASEPELEERRRMGISVFMYLMVMTALFYAAKRKIWKGVK